MGIVVEKIEWGGWNNCCHISNGIIEMIVTLDVGPRILHFGFAGGENILKIYPDQLGQTGGDSWRIYGGHRLWHAPEIQPRTYYPDNEPVKVVERDGGVQFIAPVETSNGIRKSIRVEMDEDAARVRLIHSIRNTGVWAVELAPWALTVMTTGGKAIVPLPPRGSHPEDLLPSSTLIMWPYTNMADPRWTWGRKYIMLQQLEGEVPPQKMGASVPDGWVGYLLRGTLFIKQYEYSPGKYPDLGSSVELFTNRDMLEVETLGHLVQLEPGDSVEHVEVWSLFADVPPPMSDADVDANILPKISG